MASELITLDVYNQNGFGVIGTQLEGEFSIGNIITKREEKRRKAEEQAEEQRKKEAFANIKFKSVPTSSDRQLLSGDMYQSDNDVKIVAPRLDSNLSYALSDFDYSTALSSADYVAAGTSLASLVLASPGGTASSEILKGINITINETAITEFSKLVVNSAVYVNTTGYTRSEANKATLLPMDVLTLSGEKVDIGLVVVEVYSKTENNSLKLEETCEITLKNDLVLGGNYNSDTPTTLEEEVLSTACDTKGNVYVVKRGVEKRTITDFLTNKVLEPTNVSTYLGENPNRNPSFKASSDGIIMEKPIESNVYMAPKHKVNLPVAPDGTGALCGFECYVKGFLVFNTNTVTGSLYNTNMVWLEVPTLVSVTKTAGADTYTVKIGEIITSGATAAANGSMSISTVGFGLDVVAYLPTESGFYENNFKTSLTIEGATLSIQSLAKYFEEEEEEEGGS